MSNNNFKVLQVNLNRSGPATESALQIAIELKIDLIIIQEPWIIPKNLDLYYRNTRSILHPSFAQILPPVNLAKESPLDPDLLVIDIVEGNQKIQLFNVYNETNQLGTGLKTIER